MTLDNRNPSDAWLRRHCAVDEWALAVCRRHEDAIRQHVHAVALVFHRLFPGQHIDIFWRDRPGLALARSDGFVAVADVTAMPGNVAAFLYLDGTDGGETVLAHFYAEMPAASFADLLENASAARA